MPSFDELLQEIQRVLERDGRTSYRALKRRFELDDDYMAMGAHELLLPRLQRFQERFPGIELCIETSNEVIDFKVSDYDAALRLGEGWPGLQVQALGRACVTVVCSPELARSIRTALDVCNHTSLDPSGAGERGLQMLLAAHGQTALRSVRTWHFETCYDTLRAAEHGLGVALGVFPIATALVQSGKLAVPLAERMPLPGQVCFVHRPDDHRFPFAEIAAFLHEEYRALPALPEGRIVSQARVGS